MIKSLSVKNYALIEDVHLTFAEGFTVLSGETGAGKSIIIDALSLAIGERAYTSKIRQGYERASVYAEFTARDNGLSKVSREVNTDRANRIYINGELSTLSSIREEIGPMIDIHGQHEHQKLLDKSTHLDYLDAYGDLYEERQNLRKLYESFRETQRRLKGLIEDEEERKRRRELLEYQIEEIEKSELVENEDLQLEEERTKLKNSEKIAHLLQEITTTFEGIEGAGLLDLQTRVSKNMEELLRYDPQLSQLADRLKDIQYELMDISREVEDFSSKSFFNPERLEEVEARLSQISMLKRKYGETIEEILNRHSEMKEELKYLSEEGEVKEELENKLEDLREELKVASVDISEKRKSISEEFSSSIEEELNFLGIEGGVFLPYFEYVEGDELEIDGVRTGVTRRGVDDLIFLISPNPGEEPKPLNLIASGGELSRIMLAMKTVLGDVDDVETMIFDEVDSGMGGTGALKVARRLAGLSKNKQIICVSHLPQIAAYADHHWVVEKVRDGFRNKTVIRKIGEGERARELARMIAGEVEPDEEVLKSARKILEEANIVKTRIKER